MNFMRLGMMSVLAMTIAASPMAFARGHGHSHSGRSGYVSGYVTKNGTYVHPYYRGGSHAFAPVDTPIPLPTASNTFPQPIWCKKAKTTVENLVCGDLGLSEKAIKLDNDWAAYQVHKSDGAVVKARVYLRTWNKENFQACNSMPCIISAYGEVFSHFSQTLDSLPNYPSDQAQKPPFTGFRHFNFYGGNGTENGIRIGSDGRMKIELYSSLPDVPPTVEYEGKFKNEVALNEGSGYLIRGNHIYSTEKGKISSGCLDVGLCVSEFSIP